MEGSAPELGTAFAARYEILEPLGQGGFGVVYKARQRTTGQAVALKVMQVPALDGEAQREKRIARFLREAQLCAQLHHPNVVQIVDAGRGEGSDGLLYTVFSYAPGHNLADVLAREGALAPVEARHLMLQVLDALACAHAEGVVHRDLKPRNVMVIPTGARRNALVLDFGVGAVTGAAGGELPRLTASHESVGTPGYAAPEQLRGLDPTPGADLFAWGLVFLECLTGKPVYAGSSAAEIFHAQLGADPVPIPAALERHPLGEILRAATRKDVAARSATAAAVFAALDACDLRDLPRGALRDPGWSASAAADPTASLLAPTPGGREGERRQVTAVSCFVSAAARVGGAGGAGAPDADDEALRGAIDLAASIARRHRGHVAAALGDELMVYFGFPRAEEDDALRAGRAALQILSAVAGGGVDVRIGVHTGLVVAREDGDAAGSTPRRASRLARTAPPGAVLVTADAQRLLRGFGLEAEGERPVAPGPVEVFRLVRGEGDTGPTPATPDGASAPLVGRGQEIDLLLDRWRRTCAGGGQSALVTGEPGIGKSRLLRELSGRLANDAHGFLEGRCSPDARNDPLHPILDLLGRALGLDQEATPAGKTARLAAQIAQRGLDPAEAMPLLLPLFSLPIADPWTPLDVSPFKQKALAEEAILTLLFAMAEARPLLLALEDLHWADPTTLEIVGKLVREAPSAPLFLLLTARPELTPPFPTSGLLQIQLGRLERAQVDALASGLAGGKALPPELLDHVANRTDGVPLFVEELTRAMLESGALVEHADSYELSGALRDVEVPGTLRALLTARLDRLGRARDTAQIAAALGREFSVAALVAVSPLGADGVEEDLDRLSAAGLVQRRRRVKNAGGAFKHALVRDAAYESMTKARRREVHERIARTLERDFPAVAAEAPGTLAGHFERADLPFEATSYLLRAGFSAMQRWAFVEAAAVLTHGVEIAALSPDAPWAPRSELSLRALLGGALVCSRGYAAPELETNGLRAREICGKLEDPPELFPVVFSLWVLNMVRGHRAATEHYAQELSTIADRSSDPNLKLSAYHARGTTCAHSQRNDEAVRWLRAGLPYYDPANHLLLMSTYGDDHGVSIHVYLQGAEITRGNIAEGRARIERTRALAEALRAPVGHVVAAIYTLGAHHLLDDHDRMADAAETALRLSKKHGYIHWEMLAHVACGLVQVRRGAGVEEALAGMRMGLGFLEMNNQWTGRPYWSLLLAEALVLAGRAGEARRLVDEVVAGAAGKLDQGHVPLLIRLKGNTLAAEGDRDAGLALLRQALALAKEQGDRVSGLHVSVDLARRLFAAGQAEQAGEARACLAEAVAHIHGGEGWPAYDEAVQLCGA